MIPAEYAIERHRMEIMAVARMYCKGIAVTDVTLPLAVVLAMNFACRAVWVK